MGYIYNIIWKPEKSLKLLEKALSISSYNKYRILNKIVFSRYYNANKKALFENFRKISG